MKTKLIIVLMSILIISNIIVSANSLDVKNNDFLDESPIKSMNSNENYAVIVVGTKLSEQYTITWSDLNYDFYKDGRLVYSALRNRGFDDDHILYLDNFISIDEYANNGRPIYHDGMDDVCTKGKFEKAITEWLKNKANEQSNVFLFLMDHGDSNGDFVLNLIPGTQLYSSVSGTLLNQWLENVNYNVCTIVCEFCYSGNFIEPLSREDRIIITATDSTHSGWSSIYPGEESLFIKPLINCLRDGETFLDAWETADEVIYNFGGMVAREQNPQIDDNGDGIGYGFNSTNSNSGDDCWLALHTILVGNKLGINNPPATPILEKIIDGTKAIISSIDYEMDDIYFKFEWDDDEYSDWLGPYSSEESCIVNDIPKRVKAKDEHGLESDWSDPLVISKLKAKEINKILSRLFEFFPLLNQFLEKIL